MAANIDNAKVAGANQALFGMKASELREIAATLGSPSCADALTKQGMNGEALTALLERKKDKASDILLELLPSSAPIGERLIFTRRIQEQFRSEVKPPLDKPCFKRRLASWLLPVLLLSYLAWELGSLVAEKAVESESFPAGGNPELISDAVGHMYAWLGWGPEPGTPCYESLQDHFAGAMPSRAVVERVEESLKLYGMNTGNTIFAEATCSDEINHEPGRLGSLFTNIWGSVFPMGGIGGLPYGGQAALNAFAGHVPDGGNMFIMYGPHVGISESGEVGVVKRAGQTKCTTACGALMGVYNNCLKGLTEANYSAHDSQAKFIHEFLHDRLDEIKNAESPEAMLPRVAFDMAHQQVQEITQNLKLKDNGYVVLLGGIQINTLDFREDQFLPLYFSIRSKYMPEKDMSHVFDTHALADFVEQKLGIRAFKGD